MMKSDHQLTESDSQRDNGLHHRETVSVDHGGNGNGNNGLLRSNSGSTTNNNNNNINNSQQQQPRRTPQQQDRIPRKQRRQKPKQKNFCERTSGQVRIDVDENNYAKYGKKGGLKRRAQLQRYTMFGTICIASFVLGYSWMHFTRDDSSRPRPQTLRGGKDKVDTAKAADANPRQQWKPHEKTPANPYEKIQPDKKQQPQHGDEQQQQQQQQPNSLLIPRFDTRRYVNMWEDNARKMAFAQAGQKHPKSIELEGWNYPIAFRSFPYAKQTHGPIKNLDSDYGGLAYHSIKNKDAFERVVPEDDEDVEGAFDPDSIEPETSLRRRNEKRKQTRGGHPEYDSSGKKILYEDASVEEYKNYFDDDVVHVWPKANDGRTRSPRACREAEIGGFYFPTCNDFHANDVGRAYDDPGTVLSQRPENELYVKYLAHGYYRDAWIVEDGPGAWPDRYPKEKDFEAPRYGVENEERTAELVPKAYRSTVLKTLQMKHPFSDEHFEEVQLEAVIMERMTKSPRIMGIYGHCGFSTMVEVVPIEFEEVVVPGEGYESHEDVEKSNEDGVRPRNPYTATEKLGFALEMAESLADLHGFEDGVIVHDDVQLCQWLRDANGNLKLGDFNRATIMQWDTIKGEYCKFNNGEAFANYRAPEEFAAKNLNEQIDTFSFGNNIYAMLTGLWNFYETDDDEVVQTKLIEGKTAYLDSRYKERSFAEKKLIELMEKAWIYDPAERISMFDAVIFLRKAVKENEAQNKE